MSDYEFPSLCNHRNAAIMGLVCRLLAGKERCNLSNFVLILSLISQGDHRDFMIMTLL